jgi:hypothetical protein
MGHDLKMMDALLSGLGLVFGGWLVFRALKHSESPLKILGKGLLTVALLGGEFWLIHKINGSLHAGPVAGNSAAVFWLVASVAVTGMGLSLIWTPHLSSLLISPLTNLFDGGSQPPELKPAYSAARSQRQANRPLEAIVVIRAQLAKFPHDLTGVLLLAEIQAEDLGDLPGAELTLRRFCGSARVPEAQVIAALKRLADLHLNKTDDVDAALAVMEELMTRFPEAEISRRTAQRLGRMPGGNAGQKSGPGVNPGVFQRHVRVQ